MTSASGRHRSAGRSVRSASLSRLTRCGRAGTVFGGQPPPPGRVQAAARGCRGPFQTTPAWVGGGRPRIGLVPASLDCRRARRASTFSPMLCRRGRSGRFFAAFGGLQDHFFRNLSAVVRRVMQSAPEGRTERFPDSPISRSTAERCLHASVTDWETVKERRGPSRRCSGLANRRTSAPAQDSFPGEGCNSAAWRLSSAAGRCIGQSRHHSGDSERPDRRSGQRSDRSESRFEAWTLCSEPSANRIDRSAERPDLEVFPHGARGWDPAAEAE